MTLGALPGPDPLLKAPGREASLCSSRAPLVGENGAEQERGPGGQTGQPQAMQWVDVGAPQAEGPRLPRGRERGGAELELR